MYLLRSFGHETLEADDGDEGVQRARTDRPDLILMDVHMPRMDGYAAVRALKADAELRHIPVVALTALAMVGDRERVLAAGFDGYLPKPISPETFSGQVQEFLGPREPPQEPAIPPRATILAVDNMAVNLELLRSTLQPFGYRVICFPGVRAALAAARQSPPDLIVSDLHMPESSGFDFLRAVRADSRLRCIPFILLTASILLERDQHTAEEMGATRFLSRPIEPQVLLREVQVSLTASPGA